MQTRRADTPEEINMVKLLSKIHTLEAQKSLLTETISSRELLNSKIISSLQPKVGKMFENAMIEERKQKILLETRRKLLQLGVEEKEKELQQANEHFEQMKQNFLANTENPDRVLTKMDSLMNALTHRLNKNMNKKISFHVGREQPPVTFVNNKMIVKKKRKWTSNRRIKSTT